MKRGLYFDASSGVSGDMFVGALIDAGACIDMIRSHIAALEVKGIELKARKVTSSGIAGTKFDVLDPKTGRQVDAPTENAATAGHDQTSGHHRHHRGLKEIHTIIGDSSLPKPIKDDAIAVFELIAMAEGKVHGVDPAQVHFHEVGALDSIADIVSAASAYHQLGIDEAWCSPIHVGSGRVRCAHGLLPVPAPATLELLHGIPAYSTEIQGELATPTGVALLKHFCTGFNPMPHMTIERAGYGAGNKKLEIPNMLRATIGSFSDDSQPEHKEQFDLKS